VSSIDIQTYLWYPDASGRLMLDRALHAADRGVKVRLIVDDLLTLGLDQAIYELQLHPNIEFRLFNAWQNRGTAARAGEMLARLERLNTRMHDKLVIADGHAAVVGGRNIGDHYFGLSNEYNFHDLDVLGFGEIAHQSNGMFDSFWNSEWVVSARNLDLQHDAEFASKQLQELRATVQDSPQLAAFPRQPKDWSAEFEKLQERLRIGTSELVFDQANEGEIAQNVYAELFGMFSQARQEMLITNAYIIPGQVAIDKLKAMTDQGVKVSILTNSLSSHDVPAVNSHYKGWRDDLIKAGAQLYELRPDAQIRSLVEVPPNKGEFVGLHTKAFVIDRRLSFIGSMNFDPRSAAINTEAGAFINSPELAQDLVAIMQRDMQPANAWQVLLDEDDDLYWVNSDETVHRQPARGFSQRLMDMIFMVFPKDQY
jgi:putative cardiolipin synthase